MTVRSKFSPTRFGATLPARYRLGAALVGALAASALLSGCVNNATFIDPQGPAAYLESNLWWFIFYVATGVWAVVTAVLLYSVMRFRARPGAPAPRQLHGNTRIEILWTVVPSVILFSVLAFTIYTLFSLGQPADPNTFTVTVRGHQWWWEFDYPGGVVTADELRIPTGTVVHISLRSNNVIHSFWVPQLSGKMDVIPGQNNETWLRADRSGVYRGECTEYCGTQHAHMNFQVVAQSSGDYQAWLLGQQAGAATPPIGSDAAAGLAVFNQRCYVCHQISGGGAKQPPTAPIAPNLTHLMARSTIAGGVLPINGSADTTGNLKLWIAHNDDVKPGNDMGNQGMSDTDLNNVVAYLETLK
jgi:cytochrome c oxidase subunit 2